MGSVVSLLRSLYVENPDWAWVFTLLIAIAGTGLAKSLLGLIVTRLRVFTSRTASTWDDVAVDLLAGLKAWVLFFWLFYVLSQPLEPADSVRKVLFFLAVTGFTYQFAVWGLHLIRSWRRATLDRIVQHDPSAAAALGLLSSTIQIAFVVVVVLIGLSNLGVNISALLAGLGVGGIAVALAAQNVLGDLLASLSIVLDKPFVIGDFIVAGDQKGTVTQIGIKTTRLQSLSGEELILSNKDLLESRIQNFKRMWKRRVVLSFGVVYSTPPEVMERIPGWVREIVSAKAKLEFDRCHFLAYGASSLDFELVFFVADPEYNVYMDLQESVLLDIYKRFRRENVEFAYPTQTVYVEKLPKLPDRPVGGATARGDT